MKVYHGSYIEVTNPDLIHSRENVDFGKGFYTTPIYEQAEQWARRFRKQNKKGIVSAYYFDESILSDVKVLRFKSYSEEWLDFILQCRTCKDTTGYDIVIGGVANDRVFNTVELYFDGLIDKTEAIKRLMYEETNLQITFRTEKALSKLVFERSVEV